MRSLRTAVAWTFAGNTIYAGCQWAMLVIVAKLGSVDAVGAFALAFAVTAPVMMLSDLQLRAVQATDAREGFVFGHYLAVRMLTSGAALLACLIFGYFTQSGLVLPVMLLIAVAKGTESVSDVMYGLMQRRQDMRSIAVSMILKGALSLAALGAVLYLTASLPLACLALACSWAIVLGFYDLRVTGKLVSVRPIWSAPALRSLTALAAPLGLVMGIISLQSNVSRYVVGAALGVGSVGAFAAIASLGVIGITVCNALGQVASPRLADDYADRRNRSFLITTAKLVVAALGIGIAGVAVASVAGAWLLGALFRPEYGREQDVLVILMLATGVTCVASMLGYALTAARQFRQQVPIYAASLVITGAICGWLTPSMGLRGAAIGTAAGSLTQLVGAGWALFSTVGVQAEIRRMQYAA